MIIFFSENVENLMEIPSMEQTIQQEFFVYKTIRFESGTANSHNFERDTCHQQSMC